MSTVALGSGARFAYDVDSKTREVVVERLRSFVTDRLAEAFPTTAFTLRDRRESADAGSDDVELDAWLYCGWDDGPAIRAVAAVVEACTRVEVTSPIPGVQFSPGALVHVGYGCRGRSRAGWFALLAEASEELWERAEAWARMGGYRPYTLLSGLICEAEREVWERGYGTPAPTDRRGLEMGLDLDHCGAGAWETARIAAALCPEEYTELHSSSALEGAFEWFILEGRALARAVLHECGAEAGV